MNTPNEQTADPMAFMSLLWPGPMIIQTVRTAARLRIADTLADSPLAIQELAEAVEAPAKTLGRMLTAMSSIGLFTLKETGKWSNTPLSEFMREDHPQSMRSWALLTGDPLFWQPIGELHHAIVTGKESFTKVFPERFFPYLKANPCSGTLFNQAMAAQSGGLTTQVPQVYDFSRFGTITDIGGGTGIVLAMILRDNPDLTGVLLELPDVIDEVDRSLVEEFGDRLKLQSGSFFDSVPEGLDCYMTVRVIHDWPDDEAVKILQNIRRAMKPDSTLLLFEGILEDDAPPGFAMMDMLMLALVGSMERTEEDFRALLNKSRFTLNNIIRKGHLRIIECKPA